ncbi:MAG: porphobilinogen synthase [Bacteroidia bacterium]|nr:porphobilinogen synthase [Bacteroidia bacterium]
MLSRPRRNRKSAAMRGLVQENHLGSQDLMYPLFVMDGSGKKEEIPSMPGIHRFSIDLMLKEMESCMNLGLKAFILFPAVEDSLKDKVASYSYDKGNFYLKALRKAKENFPEVVIATDVAMDPYSSDGHDGVVENGEILNDKSLPILARMTLAQAETGVDIIGPSDMMDGRVSYIREELDDQGFESVSIMSYTAKYASAFYGPFRDALESAPKFGDKKTYQMNPANKREAILEAEMDESEGADILMVKPAMAYMDVIHSLREESNLPIAAYNVSGEYAMVKAAAEKGWIEEKKVVPEILLGFKRAGADIILTYFAKQMAEYWQK